jgi:hypothetical protein
MEEKYIEACSNFELEMNKPLCHPWEDAKSLTEEQKGLCRKTFEDTTKFILSLNIDILEVLVDLKTSPSDMFLIFNLKKEDYKIAFSQYVKSSDDNVNMSNISLMIFNTVSKSRLNYQGNITIDGVFDILKNKFSS